MRDFDSRAVRRERSNRFTPVYLNQIQNRGDQLLGSKLYQFTPSELQKLLDESNGYSDLLRKINMNPKGDNPKTLKKIITELNLDETKLKLNRSNLYRNNAKVTHKKVKIPIEDIIMKKEHPNYQPFKLLKRLIKEGYKERKCEKCGLTEWQGQPIPLELHHEDGNRNNNLLNNLKILCPNCHALTNTFCGKNIKIQKKIKQDKKKINNRIKNPPISRKELKEKIRNNSFTNIGKEFGVTDNTVRKWCKKYNLPFQSRKIKKYSDSQWEKI